MRSTRRIPARAEGRIQDRVAASERAGVRRRCLLPLLRCGRLLIRMIGLVSATERAADMNDRTSPIDFHVDQMLLVCGSSPK
jgi:hypothetical protein